MSDLFTAYRYTLRSRFLRLFGGAYTISDDAGQIIGFARMKRFRLKEDIRLYADADACEPLLVIRTDSIFDFSGAYDVADAQGRRIGTLARSGLRSTVMRDHWEIRDAQGTPRAELIEDSPVKAVIRRLVGHAEFLSWIGYLLPQRYDLVQDNAVVAHYRQGYNPFVYRLSVTRYEVAGAPTVDARLVAAQAILLAAIEGRQ